VSVKTLVRTNASLVWFALCALTIMSWGLTSNHCFGDHSALAGVVILAVATFKVRLVGLYFMELKGAPRPLRGLFEGYCAGMFGLLTAMFLFG
jgi:caa(3)-type oxidase subunit IV